MGRFLLATGIAGCSTSNTGPPLLDRYLARICFVGQQRIERVSRRRKDNLFEPFPGDHGARGSFDYEARSFSGQLWATMHRKELVDGVLADGAAVAGALYFGGKDAGKRRARRPQQARKSMSPTSRTIAGDVTIGAVSGLVAAWTMNRFQNSWIALKQKASGDEGQSQEDGQEDEPATVKAADKVSKGVAREPVPNPYREQAGQVVHYGFGAFLGAVYGALGTLFPRVRSGFGTVYGTGVALTADEALVPAAGLSPPPQKVPLSTHAYSFASHLVFGAALEGSRRSIEHALKTARTAG